VERKKRTTVGVPAAVVKRVLKACKAEPGADMAGGAFMAMAMPVVLSAPSSSSASTGISGREGLGPLPAVAVLYDVDALRRAFDDVQRAFRYPPHTYYLGPYLASI